MNLTGQTLGDFQLQSVINRGPRATVYRARQLPVERVVAVKVYDESIDPDDVRRAAEQTEALTHAHVLPVYGSGVHRGLGYVAMRHMPVGSIKSRWRRAVPLGDIARILPQIAAALDHAHAHGLLHLNLTPANILLDHPGNAFAADFGIPTPPDSPYAAPEAGRDGQVDARADVYSLGAVLYEMATGRAPVARRPRDESANQRMADLPAPRSIRASIPPAIEAVVMRAMSIDPEARYATPGALAEAFAGAAEIAPIEQVEPVPSRRLLRTDWIAAGVIGLVALIAVIVVSSGANVPAAAPSHTPTSAGAVAETRAPDASPAAASPTEAPVTPTRPGATASPTAPSPTTGPSRTPAPTASATVAVATRPANTPTPAFTVVSLSLKPPANRDAPGSRLELIFDAVVQPLTGGPFGQLFAYLPDIDALVTTRIGAQVTSGTQVLKVTLVVDCAQLPAGATTDRIFLEIRPTDRGPTLYATSIDYTKQWCR